MKFSVIAALFSLCIALVSAANVKLVVSSGSNKNWIAVQLADTGVPAISIEIKQATASFYTKMTYEGTGINTGYWTYNDWSKVAGFDMPLSFRLVGSNGGVIVMAGVVYGFPGVAQTFDSLFVFATPTKPNPTTAKPTASATSRPTVPSTTTQSAAVAAAVAACAVPTKLMVPLYVYPGAAWDAVANGAQLVKTVAIINPNSGPGGAPNKDYVNYMAKLRNAGVEMVGYVHTSYGTRPSADVKAEIDIYATQFPLVNGIFLDEAASDVANVAYYQDLYNYIMSMPGYVHDIINPGVVPDMSYYSVATQIVTLEDYGSNVAAAAVPNYAPSCATKEKFAAIVHTVNSGSMQSIMDAILNKKYFGYVYVTDGAGGCCTYNSLTSYYANMAAYVGNKKF